MANLLRWLHDAGIQNFVVVAHTYADQVTRYLSSTTADTEAIQTVVLGELRDTNWSALNGLRAVKTSRALILTADTVWKIDLLDLAHQDGSIDVWIAAVPAADGREPNIAIDEASRVRRFGNDVPHDMNSLLGVGMYLVNSVSNVLSGLERPGELDRTGFDPNVLRVAAYARVESFVDFGTDQNLDRLRTTTADWPEFFGDGQTDPEGRYASRSPRRSDFTRELGEETTHLTQNDPPEEIDVSETSARSGIGGPPEPTGGSEWDPLPLVSVWRSRPRRPSLPTGLPATEEEH